VSEHAADRPIVDAETAKPVAPDATESREERARKSGYRSRFGAIYFALAIDAGAGVGSLVVLLARPDAAPAPAWSTWKPTGSETAKARQIADHVSKQYRLANGQQLSVALVGPPQVTASDGQAVNVPVRAIAVLPDTSTGQQEDSDVSVINAEGSLQFVLCGLGENCSITSGEPSEARHALLRRQALELALYTFKYVDGVDSITVFLPPRPDAQQTQATPTAVFLPKKDVRDELDRPLSKTLTTATTPGIGEMQPTELGTVNRITRPRLYGYQYQQAQDGSAVLVLSPIVS
jgi:hypothetical protein